MTDKLDCNVQSHEETFTKQQLRIEFFTAVDATLRPHVGNGALEIPQDEIFPPTVLNDWKEREGTQGDSIQFDKTYHSGLEFSIIPEGAPTKTEWRVHTQMQGYQSYLTSIHPSPEAALAFVSGIVSGITLDKDLRLVDAFQREFWRGVLPPEIKVKP